MRRLSVKQIKIFSFVFSGLVLVVLAGTLIYVFGDFTKTEEPVVEEVATEIQYEVKETEKEKSFLDENALRTITEAGEHVKNALDLRPATVSM